MEPSEIESRKIEFDRFIQAKTSQPPSYLGEYENAVEVLGQSFPFSISLETKIGHFRKYVIREFAELHLIVGGFKHFGYRNYFGHPGGPLTGHPYR